MELNDRKTLLYKTHEALLDTIPPEHQGVADALRAAFHPVKNNLPQNWADLLSQLR